MSPTAASRHGTEDSPIAVLTRSEKALKDLEDAQEWDQRLAFETFEHVRRSRRSWCLECVPSAVSRSLHLFAL